MEKELAPVPVVRTIQLKSVTFEVPQDANIDAICRPPTPIRQQKKKDGANNLAGGAKEDSEIDDSATSPTAATSSSSSGTAPTRLAQHYSALTQQLSVCVRK